MERAERAIDQGSRMVSVLRSIALVLAARILLLLAVLGGLALAVMAMGDPKPLGIGVLVSYGLLVVLPLVWLDQKKGPTE